MGKSVNNGDLDLKNKQILILEQNDQMLLRQLVQCQVQMKEEKSFFLEIVSYLIRIESVKLSKANQSIEKYQIWIKVLEYQIIQYHNESSSKQEQICRRIGTEVKIKSKEKEYRFENQQLNQQLEKAQQEFYQMKQYSIKKEGIQSKLQRENQRVSLQLNDIVGDLSYLEQRHKQLKEDLANLEQKYEKQLKEANTRVKDIQDDMEQMIENYKKEKSLNEKWENQYQDLRRQLAVQVEEVKIKTERASAEKDERLSIEQRKYIEQIEQIQQQLNNQIHQVQGEQKIKNFQQYK